MKSAWRVWWQHRPDRQKQIAQIQEGWFLWAISFEGNKRIAQSLFWGNLFLERTGLGTPLSFNAHTPCKKKTKKNPKHEQMLQKAPSL